MSIKVRFQYGSHFQIIGDRLVYKKGLVYIKEDLDPDRLSKLDLEDYLQEEAAVTNIKELWYVEGGKNITNGLKQLLFDSDIMKMVNSIGGDRTAHLYVVKEDDVSPSILKRSLIPAQQVRRIPNKEVVSSNSKLQVGCLQEKSMPDYEPSGEEDIILGSDSSSSDSDCDFNESEDEDDDIFNEFVDATVDDDVTRFIAEKDDHNVVEEHESSNSECLRSGSGSDARRKSRYPEFNAVSDFKNRISLEVGMIFASNDIFRRALRQYSIENGGDHYYLHNDKSRVSVYCKYKCGCAMSHARKKCVCKSTFCEFKACARRTGQDGTFQLKSFYPKHNCGWQMENHQVSSMWLAEKYIEHYKDDPHWRLKGFIAAIRRDYTVEVSYARAWKARLLAYTMTQGDCKEQYSKVWDYAATIRKYNPGSSTYVKVDLGYPERPLFQRLYICLDACKKGFLEACRPILGLDGCHLKGAFTGQVLVAVGKDGNENIYPVAYAVVEAERKETWVWFLENLKQDLGTTCITFMSDRQKGLLEALSEVVPMADTRVCVRHLHNNFKVKWPGKAFKDAVWTAARATTKVEFDEAMNFIRRVDEGAYLIKANPRTWSRHAFNHNCKSDMLLNNVCESFNAMILDAREKPILTMCELIRRNMMKRFVSKSEGMKGYTKSLTPKVLKRLEAESKGLNMCRLHCSGNRKFEVDYMNRRYVVDLNLKSCGCFKWDLTGIPCTHAIACILKMRLRPEDFVDKYYSKDYYLKAYNQIVQPIPDESEWVKTEMIAPQPPTLVVQPGRPKKNARTREEGEGTAGKKTRVRFGKNKCSHCGIEGHTKRKCTNPPKAAHPSIPKHVGGRPKILNNIQATSNSKKCLRRKGQSNVGQVHRATQASIEGYHFPTQHESSMSNMIGDNSQPTHSHVENLFASDDSQNLEHFNQIDDGLLYSYLHDPIQNFSKTSVSRDPFVDLSLSSINNIHGGGSNTLIVSSKNLVNASGNQSST